MAEIKGIKEGPPIYVESLMTPEEWNSNSKLYKGHRSKIVEYKENYHTGGKWRAGMGNKLSETEINNINNNIDYLLKTQVNKT